MQYSRAGGHPRPLPCTSRVLDYPMRRSLTPLLALLAGLFLLWTGTAQASRACDQMRTWLRQGGGAASGLLVVEAESGKVVCAADPERPRPLASNMKLFTTAAVLS